jgi:hypothetical protein
MTAAATAQYEQGYAEQSAWLAGKTVSEAWQALTAREATQQDNDYNHGGTRATADYVMRAYQAAKDRQEHAVSEYYASPTYGGRCRMQEAYAAVDGMKEAAGEPRPGDRLCCQRYGRLHAPVFSVTGCRWYPLQWAASRAE